MFRRALVGCHELDRVIASEPTEAGCEDGFHAVQRHRLRALKGHDLEEGVSTRLLVYCATLIESGLDPRRAIRAAMIEPLTDDPDVRAALIEVANAVVA